MRCLATHKESKMAQNDVMRFENKIRNLLLKLVDQDYQLMIGAFCKALSETRYHGR